MERPRAADQGRQPMPRASPRVAKGKERSELHVTLLRLESPRAPGRVRVSESESSNTDMKRVRDFQARRRHNNGRLLSNSLGHGGPIEGSILELGLHGKQCLAPDVTSAVPGQVPDKQAETSSDKSSTDREQEVTSTTTLPPASPRLARPENSTRLPSLLSTDFGFNTIRPDTFSGLRRPRPLPGETISVENTVAKQAQKHIAACTSLGSLRRGCRAAENVFTLRQTLGVGLRESPRDLAQSRGQEPSASSETLRKQPTVPHLLVKRNDLHRCRAEQRQHVLPKLSGNPLQVIFMQAKAK